MNHICARGRIDNKKIANIKLLSILLIILPIVCPINVLADVSSINDSIESPAYYLLAKTSNLQVDGGSNFEIDIYLIGEGAVNTSRILFYIPKYIVENQTVEYDILKYKQIDPIDNIWQPYIVTVNQTSEFFDAIDPIFYEKPIIQGFVIGNGSKLTSIYGSNMGAGDNYFDGEYHPPRSIKFSISKNAPSGDHEMIIYYFYKYLDEWYEDKKVITLHVNEWYEDTFYQNILRYGSIIALFLAIGESIVLIKRFIAWLHREKRQP